MIDVFRGVRLLIFSSTSAQSNELLHPLKLSLIEGAEFPHERLSKNKTCVSFDSTQSFPLHSFDAPRPDAGCATCATKMRMLMNTDIDQCGKMQID